MSRSKKSRKINVNGPSRPPRQKQSEQAPSRPKKRKGQAAGSRHSGVQVKKAQGIQSQADARLGSKKPVALFVTEEAKAQKPSKPLTPEVELAKLESDPRLMLLLEKLEEGHVLKQDDQAWLETTLDRIAALMRQLGIEEDEDEFEDELPAALAQSSDEDDLLAQFEKGEDLLDDYKS